MWAFAAYAAVFLVLALPWLRVFDWALPASPLGYVSDMRLIVWILSWVSQALFTHPSRLFDGPINYPAPGQITGCEHFASSQLVFAPLFWATGNGVLAANWTALLSYPAAGFAMDRLVRRLGGSGSAACVAGLVFALGPLRVPANLQVLQYTNLYLPVLYLAVLGLRDRPGIAHAALLAFVLALGVFSSYYMAVMLAVTGALLGVIELWRGGAGRRPFAIAAIAAAAVASLALAVLSIPYFRRPESSETLRNAIAAQGIVTTLLWWKLSDWPALFGGVSLCLAATGTLMVGTGSAAPQRRMARAGLMLAVTGIVLALGPSLTVDGWHVPLPFALLERANLLFFRAPLRFTVVTGFGLALLSAASFDWITCRLERRGRLAAAAIAVGAILGTRGLALNGKGMMPLEVHHDAARVFAGVRAFVEAHGDGPLLELPAFDALNLRDSEAMLHATRHRVPLVQGYTGYPVAHRAFLANAVARLPRADALADLVNATRLRWLLLAPPAGWVSAAARQDFQRQIEATGMTSPDAWELDGWTLLQVTRPPRQSRWFRAIAGGYRPGSTALGAKLAPLTPNQAQAALSVSHVPRMVWAGWPLTLFIDVSNLGNADWPISVPQYVPRQYTVDLLAVWTRLGDPPVRLPPQPISLPRDVEAGETVAVTGSLVAPPIPAEYELVIRPRQIDGADFEGTGNVPLRVRMAVLPPPRPRSNPATRAAQNGRT